MSSTTTTTLETRPAAPQALPLIRGIVVAVVVAALIAAPLGLGNYPLNALVIALIFLLPAHGLNLIVGYTGLLSLAQGMFFGVGAYAAGLLSLHFGTSFIVNVLAGAFFSALIAAPLGVPALRMKSYSFVMCTLGMTVIGETVAKNWITLTRGDMGLSGVPAPKFVLGSWQWTASSTAGMYYVALGVAAVATLLLVWIVRSPAGRCMVAIRDNQTLAESFGVPIWRYKHLAFVLSAMFAGVGGVVYAHYMTVVSPLMFQSYYANTILIICLGGGVGRLPGAVIGSVAFVGLAEALRISPELRMVIYGAVLLLLVFVFPNGLAPLFDKPINWLSRTTDRLMGGRHDG